MSTIELVLMSEDNANFYSIVVASDADYSELVQQVASVTDVPPQMLKLTVAGRVLEPTAEPISSYLSNEDVVTYSSLTQAEVAARFAAIRSQAALSAGSGDAVDRAASAAAAARAAAHSSVPLSERDPQSFASLAELPPALLRDPEQFYRIVRGNDALLAQLGAANPPLASLFLEGDREEVIDALRDRFERSASEERLQQMRARLAANPNDAEAKAAVEAHNRQRTVDENYLLAMEHSPEVFASVTMLYVPLEVNNNKLTAFVDSGAQMTIMSEDCAARCGLSDLIDRRFAGLAVGVGSQKIIGRIHAATVKIGTEFIMCSFSVLEKQPMDVLFGLDQLKRHQAVIDLGRGCLTIMDQHIPFLSERDIPKPKEAKEGEDYNSSAASSGDKPADKPATAGGAAGAMADSDSTAAATAAGAGTGAGAGAGSSALPSTAAQQTALANLLGALMTNGRLSAEAAAGARAAAAARTGAAAGASGVAGAAAPASPAPVTPASVAPLAAASSSASSSSSSSSSPSSSSSSSAPAAGAAAGGVGASALTSLPEARADGAVRLVRPEWSTPLADGSYSTDVVRGVAESHLPTIAAELFVSASNMMNQLDSPFNPSVDAGLDSMRIPPMARRAFRIVLAAQREKQSAIIETMRRALDISAARITYPQVDAIRSVMQTTGASQKAAVLALLITDGDVAAAARYAVSAMAD